MRIIIEPTENGQDTSFPHTRVMIEIEAEDLTIEQVIELLIKPALLAKGFHPNTVSEAFNED